MINLLMLDLDGTVRRTKSGQTFINDPADQEVIPEAATAICSYAQSGWKIIGITNQGGVAKGHKTLVDCIKEQRITLSLLPMMDCIILCPDDGWICWQVHHSESLTARTFAEAYRLDELSQWRVYEAERKLAGQYRKPDPGMLIYAAWSVLAAAPKGAELNSLYVGDRPEDEQAAGRAGVRFQWAKDWWEVN